MHVSFSENDHVKNDAYRMAKKYSIITPENIIRSSGKKPITIGFLRRNKLTVQCAKMLPDYC